MTDEKQLHGAPSDKYKVPRGTDPNGIQRRPVDVQPGVTYRCPACEAELRIRVSKYQNRYFAHVTGENTCNSVTRLHLAAKAQLAELLDLHNRQKIHLSMRVPCEYCGKTNQSAVPLGSSVVVEYADTLAGLRYDVALLADGQPLVAFEIRVTSPMTESKRERMSWLWYELSASEVLGHRAEGTLDAGLSGKVSDLTLRALAWTHPCNCKKCDGESAKKAEAARRDVVIEDLRQKAADRMHGIFDTAPKLQIVTGRCPRCHTPRSVGVMRSAYDLVVRNHTDEYGQEWDIALLRKDRIALGILVVQDGALSCDAAIASARKSAAHWIAVAARTMRDDHFEPEWAGRTEDTYVFCNSANLLRMPTDRCPECERIAREEREAERQRRAAERVEERQKRLMREAMARRKAFEAKERRRQKAEDDLRREEDQRRWAEEERRQREAAEVEGRRPSNRIRAMESAAASSIQSKRSLRGIAERLINSVRAVRALRDEDAADAGDTARKACEKFRTAARDARRQLLGEKYQEEERHLDAVLSTAATLEHLDQQVSRHAPKYQLALNAYRRALPDPRYSPTNALASKVVRHRTRILLPTVQRAWIEFARMTQLNERDEFSLPEITALEELTSVTRRAGPATPPWLAEALESYHKRKAGVPEGEVVRRFRKLVDLYPNVDGSARRP